MSMKNMRNMNKRVIVRHVIVLDLVVDVDTRINLSLRKRAASKGPAASKHYKPKPLD